MKHLLFLPAVLAAVLLLGSGCLSVSPYANMANWSIRQNAVLRTATEYDMFYLYPTMLEPGEDSPMNWHKYSLSERVFNYSSRRTERPFGRSVRVFVPLVHQISPAAYDEIVRRPPLDIMDSNLKYAIRDTLMALDFYFDRYHKDSRPFILYAQGQGARILYEAMKRCRRIKERNGFVAAYFVDLFGVTEPQIRYDFRKRGIRPAAGEYDTGVIICWNTEGFTEEHAVPHAGTFVLNPLSWSTDPAPVPFSDHLKKLFRLREDEWQNDYAFLKAVAVNPEKQTLELIPAPGAPPSPDDHKAIRTRGIFFEAIRENARRRVRQHTYKRQWNWDLPPVIPDVAPLTDTAADPATR